jgi:SAM-dependent methyltransferase
MISQERKERLQPQRVVGLLGLRPGMVVADIGAGSGLFTFPLAEALQGAGQVFATDIEPQAIAYLNQRIAAQGHKNIAAILVRSDGADPFYKQHLFDVILLSETFSEIVHAQDYFRGLRPSLKGESGRLCILHPKMNPDFLAAEFGDFQEVLRELAAEGERFPVRQRLQPGTEAFVRNWHGQEAPWEIREKLTRDLNAMLGDRSLFPELDDFFLANNTIDNGRKKMFRIIFRRSGRLWMKRLIASLDAAGVFDAAERPELTALERRDLRRLNRLMLESLFQSDTQWRDNSVDAPGLILMEKESVIRTLKKAGFELADENDAILNYYYILQFRRPADVPASGQRQNQALPPQKP